MAQSTRDKLRTQKALGLDTDPVPITLAQPLPDDVPSDPELDAQRAAPKPSFGDAFGASFRVDNSGYSLYEKFTSPDFAFDAGFEGAEALKNPETVDRLSKLGFADQEDLHEQLATAYNENHFNHLLSRFEKKQADEKLIMDAGAKGLLARLGANVIDPIDIGVTLAAAPVGAAVKGSKWGRILTTAATAGTANASIEATVAADNPFRDETDVMFAGAAGLVMGGSLSFLTRGENLSMEQLADKQAREALDSVGAARRYFDGEGEDPATNLAPSSENKLDEMLDGAEAPEFVPAFSRLDAITTNLRGKVANGTKATRALYGRMLEGGLLKDRSKTRSQTAEARMDMIDRALGVKFMARTDQHFKAWAKENGYNTIEADIGLEAGAQFYREVAMATRGIDDPNIPISSHARSAAAEQAKVYREVYDMAQKAGVKGFEGEPLDNFFPRIYKKEEFNRRINRHGEEGMRQFFREAISSGQDDITDELAGLFAKGMVRTMRRASSGIDQQLTHGIPLDDMDRLREVLTDGLTGDDLTRAINDVEDIAAELEKIKARKDAGSGKIDRAKRRVRLDESYSAPIKDKDGTVSTLRFTDLLENDARAVGLRYVRVLSGHIGLAKEANIKSRTDFDAAIRGVISRGEAEGVDPNTLRRETEALTRGYKLITGATVEADPSGVASQLSRTVRDINFTRSSGSFGLAQLAEYGNLLATAVGRSFGTHLPEFRGLNKRALDGKLENKVARQLEEWYGPGTDFVRHPAIRGFDEFGEGFTNSSGLTRALGKVDAPIQVGKRAASVLSLMAPIVSRMEKQASIAHVFEFSDLARKGKDGLSKSKAARWRGAGVTDEMQGRVMAEMKKHVEWDSNGRLVDMHVDRWDFDVADSFAMGLRRQASLTIQRNDISDIPEAMRGPVGRLAFQFKAFMFGSIVKQLERGIHYRDIETFVAFSTSMFVASTAYVGQTYLETIGNPDERAKKLAPQMIAGAGFSRAGWTALLVPPAATFADILGYKDVFNHRYSGLQASFLSFDLNPTSQLLRSVSMTLGAGTVDLLDEDTRAFDRADAQRALSILPFNRVLGVKNALHLIDQ